jgi:molybdate transport system ATP-binding protein
VSGALLDLDLELPLDRFTLRVAWSTDERSLGVFGPSGAGKTSLLEAIAGLRPESRGRLRVAGRTWLDSARGLALAPEKRGVGYVPQDGRLFPHLDLFGNLMFGRARAAAGRGVRIDPDRVLEVLELRGRERADVRALSGGERQRVALGRALLAGPDLLLLDEPLAALDRPLRRRILPYLIRVAGEFEVPSIVVTHDTGEVRLLSREALVLIAGREAARGAPEELFSGPEMLRRLGASEHVNVLRGRVEGPAGGSPEAIPRRPSGERPRATCDVVCGPGARLTVPAENLRPGMEAAVLVRAEDLIVAIDSPHGLSAQNVLSGRVRDLVEAGENGTIAVTVDVPGAAAPLVAAVTTQARSRLGLAPGRAVHLVFKTHSCRALPAGNPDKETR